MQDQPLLTIRNLARIHGRGCPDCTRLTGPEHERNSCPSCGAIVACAGVNLELYPGEVLGVVGESGSGKSTVLQCLFMDQEPTSGQAYLTSFWRGQKNIWEANRRERRQLRSRLMGMVYQNPRDGLDLMVTAGGNIVERLLAVDWRHVGEMRDKAADYLHRTEVPLDRMDHMPAYFSGGMQQRVQIAKALANNPSLVLLDELTTGLDISVQAGVLDLVRDIQRRYGLSAIVVSHDLSVIRLLADRTVVMKMGRVVEEGVTDQVLEDPQHPYTQLLVSAAA
ncbi:MAG: ATP-binding cassette domain-containing protein [Dehalococcoidia bacterium]